MKNKAIASVLIFVLIISSLIVGVNADTDGDFELSQEIVALSSELDQETIASGCSASGHLWHIIDHLRIYAAVIFEDGSMIRVFVRVDFLLQCVVCGAMTIAMGS